MIASDQLTSIPPVVAPLQNPQERVQAEQALKPFGLSPEYVAHCKVNITSMLTFATSRLIHPFPLVLALRGLE